MLKFFFNFLFLIQMSSAFASTSIDVKVAIEGAYPPFSMLSPKGELEGFEVELSKAICSVEKLNCNMVKVPFDSMIPSLLAKKVDIIFSSMSITEDRKKVVSFSKKYYAVPSRFLQHKGMFKDVNENSLKGKIIGVQKGTTDERFLTGNYKNIEIKHYNSYPEALMDFKNKRIDLYFGDSVSIDSEFLKKSGGEAYEFVGPSFSQKEWFGEGIGAAMRKDESSLVAKFNQGIDEVIKNGTYKKIQDKYFQFNINQER